MRTVLPAAFSSAIWYFALHCSQRNFTGISVPRFTLARKGSLHQLHQVLTDRCSGRFVCSRSCAPLPHLDRLVLEAGLLVKNGEVLQRRVVLGVEVDGAFQLLDAFVHVSLLA